MQKSGYTLFIDADDTLWENNVYYLRSTATFCTLMSSYGVSPTVVDEALHEQEMAEVPTLGYGPDAHIAALKSTTRNLLSGHEDIDRIAKRAQRVGRDLLSAPVLLLPGVRKALGRLAHAHDLILVTKGVDRIQLDKLQRSGLGQFFSQQHVVPEKNAGIYSNLLARVGSDKRNTWMIGNSPKSDINPAIEAGLRAIYVPHSSTWRAERAPLAYPDVTAVVERFSQLPDFFGHVS